MQKTHYRLLVTGIMLFIGILASCQSVTSEEAETSTPVISSTPTPRPTRTPSATMTRRTTPLSTKVRPTRTPSPTPIVTASPTPVGTLSPDGPWLLLETVDGLWVVNDDGSGFSKVISWETYKNTGPLIYYYTSIAPNGGQVILHLGLDHASLQTNFLYLPRLYSISLPDGKPTFLTYLLPEDSESDDFHYGLEGVTTHDSVGHLSWSRDGRYLAFTNAAHGGDSDIYRYDTLNGRIDRLSNEPLDAYWLTWSPDNQYIIYQTVYTTDMYNGYEAEWAIRVDGKEQHKVFDIGFRAEYYTWLGWLSNTRFVSDIDGYMFGASNLQTVDYLSGERIYYDLANGEITKGDNSCDASKYYLDRAYDPINQVVLIETRENDVYEDCDPKIESGFYLISLKTGTSTKVDFNVDSISNGFEWSNYFKAFMVRLNNQIYTINSQGVVTQIPTDWSIQKDEWISIEPAPTGSRVAFIGNDSGIFISRNIKDFLPVFEYPSSDLTWTPDGNAFYFRSKRGLYYAQGPEFKQKAIDTQGVADFEITSDGKTVFYIIEYENEYREPFGDLYVARAPHYLPELLLEGIPELHFRRYSAWVMP